MLELIIRKCHTLVTQQWFEVYQNKTATKKYILKNKITNIPIACTQAKAIKHPNMFPNNFCPLRRNVAIFHNGQQSNISFELVVFAM
jgi:hypothetical protein